MLNPVLKHRGESTMPKDTLCSIDGCGKPAKGRGWCASHWWRWRNHGDPLALKPKAVKPQFCSVEGCENPPNGKKGMCNAHYLRQYRHGDVNHTERMANGTYQKWLLAHLDYEGEDCLKWPFATCKDGRGMTSIEGLKQPHRWMCHMRHGPAPSDTHQAAHSCGKGHEGCVNPNHLRWATPVENAADREIHGTQARGEKHHSSKLTQDQVDLIRDMEGSGFTNAQIGALFGVHAETIGDIYRGITWQPAPNAIRID